jgi:DNA-binding transcriptional regulator YhcF (GntR family)/DNA-binding LacI/PurR family transcriptional regulator
MFPSDLECASLFGISPSTVKRILTRVRDEGRLCRVPGKGTFVPGAQAPVRVGDVRSTSPESVAEVIRRQVRGGALKRGELLPPLKQFALQWKISRASLMRALRILADEGMLTKVGRRWHVGSADELLPIKEKRRIVAFETDSIPFPALYTASAFSSAFRAMEHHLLKTGAVIAYHAGSELPRRARRWLSSGWFPHGICFIGLSQQEHDGIRPIIRKLRAAPRPGRPEIVVAGNVVRGKVGGVTYCLFGHANTERLRLLAQWLIERGYERVHICYDERHRHVCGFFGLGKLWVELRHRSSAARTSFHVRVRRKGSRDSCIRGLFRQASAEQISAIVGKYREHSAEELARDIRIYRDERGLAAAIRSHDACVTNSDESAARVRDCVRARKPAVRNVSVISLENGPEYLTRGISVCVIDHHTMGYQMAQALLDFTSVGRSHSGYLNVPGLLLERGTTPIA